MSEHSRWIAEAKKRLVAKIEKATGRKEIAIIDYHHHILLMVAVTGLVGSGIWYLCLE